LGHPTKKGAVVYVSRDGDCFRARFEALRTRREWLENIQLLRGCETLSPKIERDGTKQPSSGEPEWDASTPDGGPTTG